MGSMSRGLPGVDLISLSLFVLARVKKALRTLTKLNDLSDSHVHIKVRLCIEQARLRQWASEIGVVEGSLPVPSRSFQLNQNLILETLLQMHEAIHSVIRRSKQYELLDERSTDAASSAEHAILPWNDRLDVAEGISWEVIHPDKLSMMVTSLIRCNETLTSLLNQSSLQRWMQTEQTICLTLLRTSKQIAQVQSLASAFQLKPEYPATDPLVANSLQGGLTSLNNVKPNLATQLTNFKLSTLARPSTQEDLHKLALDISDLNMEEISTSQRRTQFPAWGKQLWVEWIDQFSDALEILNLPSIIEDRVAQLVHSLCSPSKPSSLHSPTSFGFIRHLDPVLGLRFGVVYEASDDVADPQSGFQELTIANPKPTQKTEIVVTNLRTLLRSHRKASLSHRFSLAFQLAEALNSIHAVGWLHRGIRSESVLFYNHIPLPGDSQTISSRSSIVSAEHAASSQPFTQGRSRPLPGRLSRSDPIQYNRPEIEITNPVLSGRTIAYPSLPPELASNGYQTRVEDDMYRHPALLQPLPFFHDCQALRRDRPRSMTSPTSTAVPSMFPDSYNLPTSAVDKFSVVYDIYSLGLVMLEIAFWSPLEQIVDPPIVFGAKGSRAQVLKIRDGLLQKPWRGWQGGIRQAVASEMGEDYAEAVTWCLHVRDDRELTEHSGVSAISDVDVIEGFDLASAVRDVTFSSDLAHTIKMQRYFEDEVLSKLRRIRI